MASDATEPGKAEKQEVKIHMDPKEERGKKKSSVPASLVPGYYFVLIMSSIYRTFMFKVLNKELILCNRFL